MREVSPTTSSFLAFSWSRTLTLTSSLTLPILTSTTLLKTGFLPPSLMASVLALIAVGTYDPLLMAYPLYLLTLYTMFIIAIGLGRMRSNATAEP